MPYTLQTFLAESTVKAAKDLVDAYLRLPEDKRAWKPADNSRTALDQMAECAILNGYTASLITTRAWPVDGYETFLRSKEGAAALSWERLNALLEENTQNVAEIIRAFPDAETSAKISLPWGESTLAEVLAFPYWNMTYHLGQINYIGSLLDEQK